MTIPPVNNNAKYSALVRAIFTVVVLAALLFSVLVCVEIASSTLDFLAWTNISYGRISYQDWPVAELRRLGILRDTDQVTGKASVFIENSRTMFDRVIICTGNDIENSTDNISRELAADAYDEYSVPWEESKRFDYQFVSAMWPRLHEISMPKWIKYWQGFVSVKRVIVFQKEEYGRSWGAVIAVSDRGDFFSYRWHRRAEVGNSRRFRVLPKSTEIR